MMDFNKKTQEDFVEKSPSAGKRKSKKLPQLDGNQKRVELRNRLKEHNKKIASEAKEAGISSSQEYARFQNAGYRGLYNGMNSRDIRRKKGIPRDKNILDYMGVMELAINLFATTQTEHKLKKENITDKKKAEKIYYEVGVMVREMIIKMEGVMPEDMPIEEVIKK